MDKIDVEFKMSSTGSYSPWHLEIAEEYGVPLMVTDDIAYFCRIGNDIYKLIEPAHMHKLYMYFCTLEKMNNEKQLTDEQVLQEIDDIVNNRNNEFTLRKCTPLDEFEEYIKKRSQNHNKKIKF